MNTTPLGAHRLQAEPPYQKHTHMLIAMGRYQQALMVADKWVEAKPGVADGWFCKSACELMMSRAKLALQSLDRALELDSDEPRYRAHRARCLVSAGQIMDGLELARALVMQEQDNPQLLDSLAVTLSNGGEAEEAIPVLERAISINPNVAQFHTNYGTMLHFCGRTEEAEAAHLRALELHAGDFQGFWLLSRLRRATRDHNFVDMFEAALAQSSDKLLARICINYALGKQYEDLEQFEQAFRHYSEGAKAALEQMPYDEQVTESLFRMYRAEFDRERLMGHVSGHDSDEPIFIVGMPRSGTTLVERIIESYDDVFAAGELHNFTHLINDRCAALNPGKSGADMFDGASDLDFAELGRAFIDSTRPRTGHTRYFIDKYPFNFQLVGPIALALPNAKFIHLQRNPIDTCFSNFKLLFMLGSATHSYDLETLASFYSQYRQMMAHWHECLPGRILDVRYEDLVQHPGEESRRITDYLGFDWRAECLEFYKSKTAVATASAAQVREPINTASLKKWKKFEAHLDPLKAALAEHGIAAE